MKSCGTCALRRREWPGSKIESPTGFCIWFLKKLQVPRVIPADVVAVGCKNWRGR